MKKFIYILVTIFMISTIQAGELHTVFNQSIDLSKNKTGKLSLLVGEREYLALNPALIMIDYEANATKRQFLFTDTATSKNFPIYYFDKMSVNTKKDKIVNLSNKINIFDINDDGKNEIFIYGRSYYGINGFVDKVVILQQDKDNIIQLMGLIQTTDLSEIKYIESENIIIVAQSIWESQWGSQLEEYSRNKHRYEIDIYEINNKLHKVPIFTTDKKYNDQNGSVISDVLDRAISKYHIYKKDLQNAK